jgi:hypothetical protein
MIRMKFSPAAWEVAAINALAEGGQGSPSASRAVRHLLQSSSAPRFTVAQAGFFDLSQSAERPLSNFASG